MSEDATGAPTLNPAMLLCAALPCVVQSISFDQNCQLHSSHTTVRCCVCVCARHNEPAMEDDAVIRVHEPSRTEPFYHRVFTSKCYHTHFHTHTSKPLKTQSQWTQTSSLVYCFNMCRRSRHCEKSYGSASIGCDEQPTLLLHGEFS